ncbi:glycosyltransferase [Pseudogemmobacter sonorensis]|uniref:glycosyltransferase n=1 Tax=Pseudogemmobacter sonorensis TaxID=2989681 RepID=UPI0036800F59
MTILMGVYNGARHMALQLESFAAQSHRDWWLVASDDGSSDASRRILADFAAARPEGQVKLVDGPRCGFSGNYLSMLRHLPEAPGWLAFSDQDDVWLPDRLERGIAALRGIEGPALYCGRTWVTDDALNGRRLSRGCPRPTGFRHALVQNVAAGNTILANAEAGRILAAAARRTEAVVAHDWWAYQLITGAGGRVVFDDRPTVLYRQHGGNAIGANDGWISKLRRLRLLAQGVMAEWTDTNIAALEAAAPWLTEESRGLVQELAGLRHASGPLRRVSRLRRLGLYRQTRSSTAALWVAAAFRRL